MWNFEYVTQMRRQPSFLLKNEQYMHAFFPIIWYAVFGLMAHFMVRQLFVFCLAHQIVQVFVTSPACGFSILQIVRIQNQIYIYLTAHRNKIIKNEIT